MGSNSPKKFMQAITIEVNICDILAIFVSGGKHQLHNMWDNVGTSFRNAFMFLWI